MTLVRHQTPTKSIKFSLVVCELRLGNNCFMFFFLTFPSAYALHFIHYLVYNRTYKRFTEELYTTTVFNMVYMIKLRF